MYRSSAHHCPSRIFPPTRSLRFCRLEQRSERDQNAIRTRSVMLTGRLYQQQPYSPARPITQTDPTGPVATEPSHTERGSTVSYCGLPLTASRTSFLLQNRSEVSTSVYSLITHPSHKSWPLHYDWKPGDQKKGYIVERQTAVHDMISWSN
jgi:hypothetical protein